MDITIPYVTGIARLSFILYLFELYSTKVVTADASNIVKKLALYAENV